jgi:hypothetical protein
MTIRIYNFNGDVRDVEFKANRTGVFLTIKRPEHVYYKHGHENPLNLLVYEPKHGDILFELPHPTDCYWSHHREEWLLFEPYPDDE